MDLHSLQQRIVQYQYRDETSLLEELVPQFSPQHATEIQQLAIKLTESARSVLKQQTGLSHFIHEYDLRSEEGVLLMCLSEALLRIPDSDTRAQMVNEILSLGRWDKHLGNSASLLVNASTWGLYLGSRFLHAEVGHMQSAHETLHHMTQRLGKNVAQAAMVQAVKLLADQFVMGTDIESALQRVEKAALYNKACSFDCLGEAAQTAEDVENYFSAYRNTIDTIARVEAQSSEPAQLFKHYGISIKLSALHPRYDSFHRHRVMQEMLPRLRELILAAKKHQLPITLDAEEAARLELSLDIFHSLWNDRDINHWPGLGLAVQAYQKRALPVLHWLQALAHQHQTRIPLRLVKGAYWDSEIKWAQQAGLGYYPVFTRKSATDINYLVCARYMLQHPEQFYAQFATHNAHTIAFLLKHGRGLSFEFQRLHGMGDAIYQALTDQVADAPPCRIYAPIGQHETLLPYLVRRLLENGANSSFVNQLADDSIAAKSIVQDPLAIYENKPAANPIPLPHDLYQPQRLNSTGLDLYDAEQLTTLQSRIKKETSQHWQATALINGKVKQGDRVARFNPASLGENIGTLVPAEATDVLQAFHTCEENLAAWQNTPVEQRAAYLEKIAELFSQHRSQLMARIVGEAGRTFPDAQSEVREAIDFSRYYAAQARRLLSRETELPGPTGEDNRLYCTGRGIFACISPWNFPLAIFTGQIVAALVCGNAVLAKPAADTVFTGQLAIDLMHRAGIPAGVLHYLPGDSRVLGPALLDGPQLAGVAFTGSFETAQQINRRLAQRNGPVVPLIAETGGVNVMFADSSCLPDQLVNDVLQSAFNSAGQRCSALRVLLLQADIADTVLPRLSAALQEWRVGDPADVANDIGPLISAAAKEKISRYCEQMARRSQLVAKLPLDTQLRGYYVAPHIFEIDSLTQLAGEVFGPVLHVMRYEKSELESLIESVNDLGYGLTMGVHSRLRSTWETVRQHARVGNLYINRNMIGAVVGSQPFGGEGLSGTGPKAGGPHYLLRFCHERCVSTNTAAIGGNTELLRQ